MTKSPCKEPENKLLCLHPRLEDDKKEKDHRGYKSRDHLHLGAVYSVHKLHLRRFQGKQYQDFEIL